jgi:hypothetical protein
MNERFHDDNFIEAAKVYQSIKAPSDLREKILTAAEIQADTPPALKNAERKRAKGRILQIASVAACLAVMFVALPDWQGGLMAGNEAAIARAVSDEENGLEDKPVYDPEAGDMTDPLEFLESQIPAIFGPEAELEDMEITMASQNDTLCVAEIITEKSITMEITLEKNADTGCWEVTCVREKSNE